jgi:hypothetical protein
MSSVLDFLGIRPAADQAPEFDRVLTDWILAHSPDYQTKVRI